MSAHARTLLSYLRRVAAPATPDAALLARWLHQRDQDAFAALMARHGPMVLGVCRRLLGGEQDAEDVFQAVFLVLARRADRLRKAEALAGFLHTVAVRLARKARAAAQRCRIQTNRETPEPIDPQPHPLDLLSGRELLALLDAEIARLPEVYRLPLLLCLLQGRTVEEAARQLGWSIGSLRGRLTRGRERLRQRLARRGLHLSVGSVAFLTPAALPDRLQAVALAQLAAPTAAVRCLAAGWTSALRPKTVCLGLVLLSAVGMGTVFSFLLAPVAEKPVASLPTAPPQAKDEPGRDRYGDPLPAGAIARLGTLRFRAPGEITSLAFAPDGKTVAVASRGGLFLFDAASGKRLQQLSLPNRIVEQKILLAFSPDGKRLARRGSKLDGKQYKGVVFVWELAGKGDPRAYDADRAVWVGWSTDGEPLAVCLEKDGVRLRELASGRSRRFECKDLRRPELYQSVACTCAPAGKTLAIADEKRRIHIWDTATGRPRCVLPFENNTFIRAFSLSTDGRILASLAYDPNSRDICQLWDASSGKHLHTLAADQKNLHTIIFAPDGKTLATASYSEVRFWDVTTGRERGRVRDFPILESTLAFCGDGKWLATAIRHGSAFRIWDVAGGESKNELAGHRCRPYGTAFAPDGRLATGGSLDGTIYIWNPQSGEALTRIQRGQWVRDIAFSPDGCSLFSTWTDEELWISDAASGAKQHVLKLEDSDRPDTYQSAISMSVSSDGKTLVVSSHYYARKNHAMIDAMLITGWDTSSRKQLFRRQRPGVESWMVLSADARVLAATYPSMGPKAREDAVIRGRPIEQRLRLEDVATGEPLLTLPMPNDPPSPLAFSPDGRLLATYRWRRKAGEETSTLHLWETATAANVLSLGNADHKRVAFSPDGQLLALISKDQQILVYDLARRRERQRFGGFAAAVTYIAFSPDGRRLVSGLDDSTLLIWDIGRPERTTSKLDAQRTAKAWADLAGADAPRAFRARWTLVSAPEQAIPLLRKHLHPTKAADPKHLQRLLADLDSEQFAVREKVQKELENLGDLAEPALRETLTNKPSLEMRQRAQTVLERLRGPVKQPEMLQALRAVAVLEDIGTSEARQLLEELAKGAAESRLTREAKASLQRLERRRLTEPRP